MVDKYGNSTVVGGDVDIDYIIDIVSNKFATHLTACVVKSENINGE